MPPWFWPSAIAIGWGVILFVMNKLTTKSSAELLQAIENLKHSLKELDDCKWTTEQKVLLEKRLTSLEGIAESLRTEVNFTKTSHQEFLRLLERALIPVAHSPHTPELDRLLEKRDNGEELSSDEWRELIERLGEEAKHYDDESGKKVSLLGLRAIYLTHLRQAQRKEGKTEGKDFRLMSGEMRL